MENRGIRSENTANNFSALILPNIVIVINLYSEASTIHKL